jgi:signal transduction histidine kinase/CHASE2 domain-containing sensor protein
VKLLTQRSVNATSSSQRAFLEWVVLVVLLSSLLFALTSGSYRPHSASGREYARQGLISYANNALLDTANRLIAAPLRQELILIEIDEISLGQLGRWPWKRSIHAKLIDRLSATPNRVLLDVLFPEESADDVSLSQAISKHGQVFLPIAPLFDSQGNAAPIYPVPGIGKSAKALGHAQFSLDGDAVVRGLYLNEGGFNAVSELLAGKGQIDLAARDESIAAGQWLQKRYVILPAVSNSIERVSYGQVIRGDVPIETFKNKIVLVGATAKGLGDSYANALLASGSLSPGVELHAVAANAMLNNKLIQPVNQIRHQIVSFLIFGFVMILLYRLRPGTTILMMIGVLLLTLIGTLIALQAGFWLAPGGLIVTLFLAYPLWSWRRLEAAFVRLAQRAQQLASSPLKLPNMRQNAAPIEPIAKSLQALDDAAEYALTLRDFLRQIIDEIPYPVWVGDKTEKPLISNLAVDEFFPTFKTSNLPIAAWLKNQFGELTLEDGKEFFLNDHSWLLRIQSFSPTQNQPTAGSLSLYQLVDVTTLRQTQRERDQMMRFLSHDMRSPQVSILSILQQQSESDKALPWIKNIKTQTERTLELAEGVVQLARAESAALRSEPIAVESLLSEASDTCWSQAGQKGIKFKQSVEPEDLEIFGDPNLLRRAFINLIDNAIKFSVTDASITLRAYAQSEQTYISVEDKGVGVAPEQINKIFTPYWRANDKIAGVGLGLSFVNLVATRHAGQMMVEPNEPQGCKFTMVLPNAKARSL